VCRKIKYILQKPTPKIKQAAIQLAINQLFQKLKSKNTNKHILNRVCACTCSSYSPHFLLLRLAHSHSSHQVNLRSHSDTLFGPPSVPSLNTSSTDTTTSIVHSWSWIQIRTAKQHRQFAIVTKISYGLKFGCSIILRKTIKSTFKMIQPHVHNLPESTQLSI
jgi:hypothetical protein